MSADIRLYASPNWSHFYVAISISQTQPARTQAKTVVLNEKKTHVGLVVFDVSEWPWSTVEASIDGNQIDLVEEKRTLLKFRKDGLPIFVRPSPSPTDEAWMKGSPGTAP